MEKSKLWTLVLLILAFFLLFSIEVDASSVSSGDLFEVEEPIIYYDGISTFSLREDSTSQTGMLYLYQWDSANQVDVLAYNTSYSVGANLVTAAAYHTAFLWFYNQSFGEGEIAIDFTINIPNTTGYGDTPITIDLISGDSVIESGSFSVGSHSIVFSGDYTDVNNIRFKIATGVPAAQFDITINSIEFTEAPDKSGKNIFELLKEFFGGYFNNMDESFDSATDKVVNGYDASGAVSTNDKLNQSLDDYEAQESVVINDAQSEVGTFDTSGTFDFVPALVSSLSLVTTFANGFFNASGDFTTAITVLMSLVFVSVVIGLLRFVRG